MKTRRYGFGPHLAGLAVLLIGWPGCGSPPPPPGDPMDQFKGTKLVVGVVGDPAIARSLAAQRGEWVARTSSELGFLEAPIDPRSVPFEVDVLVYPGERLGDLVDTKALAVLPEALVAPPAPQDPDTVDDPSVDRSRFVDTFRLADIVPADRDQVSKYGPDRFGLPIGGSALVLAFQRGAFTDPILIKAAQEAGITLAPPQLWTDFDALARFFHGRDLNGDGMPDFGVALAWGADAEGVGNATYLARVAAAALHPDQYSFLLDPETTEPRVTTAPFVEALQALVNLQSAGPPAAAELDASAARLAFKEGRVALLIDRAEMASSWGTGKFPIGVAPLPGSARVFDPSRGAWDESVGPSRPTYLPLGGGWLVGIHAKTAHRRAAEAFVRYLAGPETTDRLRAERDFPMLAVRSTQLNQGMANPRSSPGVEARSWADAVVRTMTVDKVVPGLRIPGAPDYLADLSTARVAASHGQAADAALKALAAAWTKRTQTLGSARQTWHHRRSLNGPMTTDQPPAR